MSTQRRNASTPAIPNRNRHPLFPTRQLRSSPAPRRKNDTSGHHQTASTPQDTHHSPETQTHPRIVINWGGPRPCRAACHALAKIHFKIVPGAVARPVKED